LLIEVGDSNDLKSQEVNHQFMLDMDEHTLISPQHPYQTSSQVEMRKGVHTDKKDDLEGWGMHPTCSI